MSGLNQMGGMGGMGGLGGMGAMGPNYEIIKNMVLEEMKKEAEQKQWCFSIDFRLVSIIIDKIVTAN